MLHLRLIVPEVEVGAIVAHLHETAGVAHVITGAGTSTQPTGELVLCDVAREAANDLVEWLQEQGVHERGAISIETVDASVSSTADAAEAAAPGQGGDALVWQELVSRIRQESVLTVSFLAFMAVAAVIAGVGILLDSPILVIGAMVVGPEYGPLAALCVAAVRRRARPAAAAALTLAIGLVVAAAAALIATVAFRLTNLAPDTYGLDDRELTAFISHPDGMAAVVAVLAGIVGMLALTEARGGALVGVLVAVTTIPAAGNVGVASAYGEWGEVVGAALQLAINLTALCIAGIATLAVQARVTAGDD